ncbi:Iron/ascorbate family oxidoreductase [Handroanthus impetiginosus]|uniref:Iron/ascorbate family oxidoreductase n=1 Tax=Handroanthus impetiginosus TaxID=429701 RepID=A0A2G9I3S5_9LAMI|nr:Iron/ascorbate family oxidoreductase [Handroanthus impetiginosus]
MDSTLILNPPLNLKTDTENTPLIFDPALLEKQENLPTQFKWPNEELACKSQQELVDPPVDLKGFFNGDEQATILAAEQIRTACLKHGFFQIINHGVDDSVIRAAHENMDVFFKLPLSKKVAIKRKPGGLCGYSGAHADRFSSKLPWKETLSISYRHADESAVDVVEYIKCVLGEEFEEAGYVYQKYCEAMKNLSQAIFELLAISLAGVDRYHYCKFFEDSVSMMRMNNYPPCKEDGLTLGTGPHTDPNSLTILHQDQVGGLEIFSDDKWQAIRPRHDAFVVNIADTFMQVLFGLETGDPTYSEYFGHFMTIDVNMAVVNKESVRRSLVFFVNPKEDKVVRPPQDLMRRQEPRLYPDFTWSDLQEFTQNQYRADTATIQNFVHWLSSQKKTQP